MFVFLCLITVSLAVLGEGNHHNALPSPGCHSPSVMVPRSTLDSQGLDRGLLPSHVGSDWAPGWRRFNHVDMGRVHPEPLETMEAKFNPALIRPTHEVNGLEYLLSWQAHSRGDS